MRVRCSLCGGETSVEPGQEMLVCSYCGAALAVDAPKEPERLILSHKRNDRSAEEALESFLIEKERGRPTKFATTFAFAPFSLIEGSDGKTAIASASRSGVPLGNLPHLPAGNYRFFDESPPAGETVQPVERIDPETKTIVHIPLYSIRYETASGRGKAVVIGGSWHVIADELPSERPRAMNVAILLGAIALFVAYFTLGKLASNLASRLVLIAAASSVGYGLFNLHEKVGRQR
jgi:hypothetical protein